jgi:segregation and condensation protein A
VEDSSLTSSDSLELHLEGFDGPLYLLLDLARRQRVDLTRISVLTLVDQYVAAITSPAQVDVSKAVEWLVMAAWLTWLKSRLLVPKDAAEAREAEQEAENLTAHLAALERIREVTAWLEQQPQLGRDSFGAGQNERLPGAEVRAGFPALLDACLTVFRYGRAEPFEEYLVPLKRALWTPAQAIVRMRAMLQELPDGGDLLGFVPKLKADLPDRAFRLRSAIASTLIAGLELTRDAQAGVNQEELFGRVIVRPRQQAKTQAK